MDLAVLESVTKEDQEKTKELLNQKFCTCKLIEGVATLYIVVELRAGEHTALVEIQKTHKNITRMEEFGFSVKKVKCPCCGGSFDATRERHCAYCGEPYDMREDGWTIMELRMR